MANWIHPAYTSLVIAQSFVQFQSQEDRETWEQVISLWQQADKSRNEPKELLRLFGEGFACFFGLPDNLKRHVNVYVSNAAIEAGHIANANKIRVTFSTEGAVFG
jgi:hypothetical protein